MIIKTLPISFCKKALLFLINSKAMLDVTNNVRTIYQVESTIAAVRIKYVLKIISLSTDINCE